MSSLKNRWSKDGERGGEIQKSEIEKSKKENPKEKIQKRLCTGKKVSREKKKRHQISLQVR